MTEQVMKCPVCDGEMRRVDLPNFDVGVCLGCSTIGQRLNDGVIRPIDELLQAHLLGDDRVRAAVSKPHVSSVPSFCDLYEKTAWAMNMELNQLAGALRVQLAQVENRIHTALTVFAEMAMVSDKAMEGLRALREASDMVSTEPRRTRGLVDGAG